MECNEPAPDDALAGTNRPRGCRPTSRAKYAAHWRHAIWNAGSGSDSSICWTCDFPRDAFDRSLSLYICADSDCAPNQLQPRPDSCSTVFRRHCSIHLFSIRHGTNHISCCRANGGFNATGDHHDCSAYSASGPDNAGAKRPSNLRGSAEVHVTH